MSDNHNHTSQKFCNPDRYFHIDWEFQNIVSIGRIDNIYSQNSIYGNLKYEYKYCPEEGTAEYIRVYEKAESIFWETWVVTFGWCFCYDRLLSAEWLKLVATGTGAVTIILVLVVIKVTDTIIVRQWNNIVQWTNIVITHIVVIVLIALLHRHRHERVILRLRSGLIAAGRRSRSSTCSAPIWDTAAAGRRESFRLSYQAILTIIIVNG